ncbi:regulator of nonsense transcripts 1-like [Teleopsis dalmanni]|uniref:regulator of nonsense transcripts 1-like n=1 Tax=Teleopsis dalmanni TaxID=139649 RepID=UPI0018CDACD4|nr:regulator of nonsense transcripts 1-like [Teleopsis dalmanni]
MAAVQRKLVHKQFNSPMGLYSQQNVKETLDRELKAFGADGIEVDDQITKPLNLANSAVLRAVEEEEEMKCGYKRVAWPPVSEERIIREFTPQPQPQPPQGQYYSQPTQQPAQQQPRQQQPPAAVAPAQPQQPISQDQTDYQQQQQLPQDYRGASPGIITLRKEAPVSQVPAPVYTSQPAAVSFGGGSNMRGDLKWPPPEYKEAAARENEERRALALGPVCRPRRINRDYTSFFQKNALNCYYPGYKVPPGTQHMFA